MSAEVLQVLHVLKQAINPGADVRKAAERQLLEMEKQPGFAVTLLTLLETDGDRFHQQLAAVHFKNMVRKYWSEENGVLAVAEREQIKTHILTLMCRVDPSVRPSLSEVVRIIGVADFPDNWKGLLPDLSSKLQRSQDFPTILGLLETANTLFKMFRDVVSSDPLLLKLKYCLDEFAPQLLTFYKQCTAMLVAPGKSPAELKDILAALRLLTRIYFSLNWQDLPEFFEDHIDEWMGEFRTLLAYSNPALASDDEEKPGPVELVQVAILDNLKLYANKYEEEFRNYITPFTEQTWGLLMKAPNSAGFDPLVVLAMKFLGQLVANVRLVELFKPTLGEIIRLIVVPNLRLREFDVDTFEENPMEYIRRDIEGSDSDTRRRVACDLIRNMCRNFEAETTKLCEAIMGQLISEYSADPAQNWDRMDAAITMVIALAVRGSTQALGVTELNQLVNVDQFFKQFVLPGLIDADVNSQPVVKADVIKFFSTFRNQMPRDVVVSVLPALTRLLQARSFVVHTYAASALERVFMIRGPVDPSAGGRASFVYGPAELGPVLEPAVVNLFTILEQHEAGIENEYVVKAIMRLLAKAPADKIAAAAPAVLGRLKGVLQLVCERPQNPIFIHYLFESIAVLIRSACKVQPAIVEQFEQELMPAFQYVLQNEIQELTAYVFQILAMILEVRPAPSETYLGLFGVLLRPPVWENRGNIPALVRLIEAYLRKAAKETVGSNPQQLQALLGVFQKLLSMRSTADLSVRLLVGIVEFLPTEVYANYLRDVFQLLLNRLQVLGPKLSQPFVHFIAVMIDLHGSEPVQIALDAINPGVYPQILNDVLVPSSGKIKNDLDRKACIVAMTRVLAEAKVLQSPQYVVVWSNLFVAVLNMFESAPEQAQLKSPEEALAELEEAGYSSSFTNLVYAQIEVRDSVKAITDPKQFFVTTLASASAAQGGAFSGLIAGALQGKPAFANVFKTYCDAYKVAF